MPEISESQIRFGIFIGLFVLLALLELFAPRRELSGLKAKRWITNWSIILIDSLVMRLVPTIAAFGFAIWAQENGFGLFNIIELPLWLAVLISFIVLDFAIWFSHLASHKIPILWLVHRMHHTDVDIDVTTAIRFHPIEIFLSMLWKILIVVLLGAPAISVLIFEIVLNGAAMFNHSNIKLPLAFDRILRIFIVTPDMHRVHHSIIHNETDSNYGFNLAIWDRLFGTYIDQPKEGHLNMKIGLAEWQNEKPSQLIWSLKLPFIGKE